MKRSLERVVLALVVTAILAAPAAASNGYFSLCYGAKNKGMGGAGSALPQDTLTASLNPAGMVFVGGGFDAGMDFFTPNWGYTITGAPSGAPGTFPLVPERIDGESHYTLVPHVGYNRMIGPDSSFGILLYGNGGINTTYPDHASGGAGTFYAGPAGVAMEQVFVLPTYSRKINETSSWGVSALLAYQRFKATGLTPFGVYAADGNPDNLTNRGTDHSFGLGAKVGVQAGLSEQFTFAASYQTRVDMSKLDRYSDLFVGGGRLDIPPTGTLGLAWKPADNLAVAFDVQQIWYTQVPTMGNPGSNLFHGLATGDTSMLLGGANGPGFGWRDMTAYKLGVQWQPAEGWALRTGASYARQPIPGSEVLFNILAPGTQEWHLTAGATRDFGPRGQLTLAVMYAPRKSVRGFNPLEAPSQQQVEIRMRQFDVETSWAIRF